MRVRRAFEGVSAEEFRNNFDQAFSPDQQVLEMVRRISLREYEEQQKKNRASEEAVKKLPVITIEAQHCRQKPLEQGNIAKAMLKKKRAKGESDLEPPTCAVCMEKMSIGKEGMFMPCGHIYHPDCLRPWFERSNKCPMCRYELPKQEDS